MFENLYRGFFPGKFGKGKAPAVPNIDEKYCKPLEQLQGANSVLGYLRDDVLLIDFDTAKDCAAFDRILNGLGLVVPSLITTHGKHYYFLANNNCQKALTKVLIACGLKADFKLGSKRGLDCIKLDGTTRQWINPTAPLIQLPNWCRPLKDSTKLSNDSLAELQTGSRNDTLFKYNGRLLRAGFSMVEAQSIIRDIINPYVLSEPLSEADIITVTRDEVYVKDYNVSGPVQGNVPPLEAFYEGRTFRHDRLSEFLVKYLNVIEVDNTVFYFDNKCYSRLDQKTFGRKLVGIYPQLTDAKRNEVYKQVLLSALDVGQEKVDNDLKFIAFNNGLLNIENFEMEEPSPKHYVFNLIPHNYNAFAVSDLASRFINAFCSQDNEVVNTIYELVGHCLYRRNTIRGCFLLVGNKRNGKSTFLDFLSFSLGKDNVSQLKMQEINERFKTAELEGKLANIGDDISDEYISDPNKLKSAVTSNPLTVERKGEDPKTIVPYATQIFSANEIPRVKDPSGAMLDRLNIIPCKGFFSAEQPGYDPDIGLKLATEDAAEFLLSQGVVGLKRILSNKQLTQPACAQPIIEDYQNSTNPVMGFLRNKEFGFANISTLHLARVDDIYQIYLGYCESMGVSGGSKYWFVRRMKLLVGNLTTKRTGFGLDRVNCFCKINEAKGFTFNF